MGLIGNNLLLLLERRPDKLRTGVACRFSAVSLPNEAEKRLRTVAGRKTDVSGLAEAVPARDAMRRCLAALPRPDHIYTRFWSCFAEGFINSDPLSRVADVYSMF